MTKFNLVRPFAPAPGQFSLSAREMALIAMAWVATMIALAMALGLGIR